MEFALLGPLTVAHEGDDLTPRAEMVRKALALLLVRANRLVPTELLVEELWDATPPRLARKTVQTYMYQLRQLLGPGADARLRTQAGGYLLEVEPGLIDAHEFQDEAARGRAALAQGDPGAASELLAQALRWWRGAALEGLTLGPVLAGFAARLDELWLGATEQRIDAELRLGHHRELLPELRELLLTHPTNEPLCADLMLAAYRADERELALAAYGALRRAVAESAGLEPSSRLRELQLQILNEDPALDWRPHAPCVTRRLVQPAAPLHAAARKHTAAPPVARCAHRPRALHAGRGSS
jgi:DNA-binding SARP family transcriptional activator